MQISFQSPGDIAFIFFGLPVYWYGIIMAIAILCGILTSSYITKNNKQKIILNIMPYIIIIGIIGARIYYCLVNFHYYIQHPIEIFYVRQGGLSIHGMIIAGLIGLYYFSRKYKIKFFELTDIMLCGTILAQSIGRWGNFFNSEAFGIPCDLPWKLYIPIYQRPVEYINYEYFHPTFLYESILDFFVFLTLLICYKKFSRKSGTVTCLYLILYSIVRILVESLRVDSTLYILNLPVAQFVSIFMIAAGTIGIFFIKKDN